MQSFSHPWFITGFVTKDVRRVLHAEHELLFKALEFIPGFSGFRDARSLALCVTFVDHCLSFCLVNFGHVLAFSFTIEYLQTFLTDKIYFRSFTYVGTQAPTVVMISTDYIDAYKSIYIFIIEVFSDIHKKNNKLTLLDAFDGATHLHQHVLLWTNKHI